MGRSGPVDCLARRGSKGSDALTCDAALALTREGSPRTSVLSNARRSGVGGSALSDTRRTRVSTAQRTAPQRLRVGALGAVVALHQAGHARRAARQSSWSAKTSISAGPQRAIWLIAVTIASCWYWPAAAAVDDTGHQVAPDEVERRPAVADPDPIADPQRLEPVVVADRVALVLGRRARRSPLVARSRQAMRAGRLSSTVM